MMKLIHTTEVQTDGSVQMGPPGSRFFRLKPGAANVGGFPITVILNDDPANVLSVDADAVLSGGENIESIKLDVTPGGGVIGDVWTLYAGTTTEDAPISVIPTDGYAVLTRSAGGRILADYALTVGDEYSPAFGDSALLKAADRLYLYPPRATIPPLLAQAGLSRTARWPVRRMQKLLVGYSAAARPGMASLGVELECYATWHPDARPIFTVPMGSAADFAAALADTTPVQRGGSVALAAAGAFSDTYNTWDVRSAPYVAIAITKTAGDDFNVGSAADGTPTLARLTLVVLE